LNYEVKTSSERVESVKNDIINSLGAFQEYNVLQKFARIPPVSLDSRVLPLESVPTKI
jgi:hypothetical protein